MRLLVATLLLSAVGLCRCHGDPYCLNCADQGPVDGFPVLLDLTQPDLTEQPDLKPPPDLSNNGGDGGPCIPTNGGVEICDKLDNDCNGVTDDVQQSKLVGDPN